MSISWLSVRGAEKDVVLQTLGLKETSERDELPAEWPTTGAALASGWYVVVFDRYGHELVSDDMLSLISGLGEVVAAAAEEHVMCCFSSGWHGGQRLWSVMHDAQAGIDNLEVEGEMPAGFDDIRRELLAQQHVEGGRRRRRRLPDLFRQAEPEGVDYVFDIPLDTAKLVTGFSYNETEPADGFVVLRSAG